MLIFGLAIFVISSNKGALQDVPESKVAFLDSRSSVTVGFRRARTVQEVTGQFLMTVGSRRASVARIEPASDPDLRSLPRTEGRVVLPGSFQSRLGGKDWDPDGDSTQMTEERPGVFSLVLTLPEGRFEYKIARNGTWEQNWGADFAEGGANLSLQVPKGGKLVRFVVDFNEKTIKNSLQNPGEVVTPARAEPKKAPAGPARYTSFKLKLGTAISTEEITRPMSLKVGDEPRARTVFAREVLSDPAWRYDGNDLGARWQKKGTTFKVWSPVASKARLLLYRDAKGGTPAIEPMHHSAHGTWTAWVPGDLHGRFYQFQFESYGETRVATDLYSFAASPDSRRSMVVDLSRTKPAGWPVKLGRTYPSTTDVSLYEISVRDFTSSPTSGVPAKLRGKYAGLIQAGTTAGPASSQPTGLSYLKQLGVSHVHLLPVHNFLSRPGEYTWGYATNLFNVPEETYSATPNNPVGVLREFKQMVAGLHRNGIGVVLDVVYNHTWPPSGKDSAFWQTAPYYYFRTNDQGDVLNESGVGNALHDGRPMARKFVRDSLIHWLKEYQVDGFRFDLLGMHQPESVRDWARAVRAVRPDAVIYGEPWTGGGPTRFGKGAQRGSTVAVFNDDFRNVWRGELDGSRPGFGMGGEVTSGLLESVLGGSPQFADQPTETINYVSAHDNMTLRDRIALSIDSEKSVSDREALREASVRLMLAATVLSPGVPFLEGGVELGRTKGGNENSYNSGDAVNGFDWARAKDFADTQAYLRGLLQIRARTPLLRIATVAELKKKQVFLRGLPEGVAGFRLKGENGKDLVVLFNGSVTDQVVRLPDGSWQQWVDGVHADRRGLGLRQRSLKLPPLSAAAIVKQ